jgi:hypothetical protein
MRTRLNSPPIEIALATLVCLCPRLASAQNTPTPPSPAPPVPAREVPAAAKAPPSLDAILKRLDELERANQKLQKQVEDTQKLRADYQRLSRKYDDLSRKLGGDRKAGSGACSAGGTPEG